MAPQLRAMVDHCVEALGIEIPIEIYAYASPQFNAACFKPEEGRLFVMFSSSLLEAFSETELLFVMGHEFGHHLYRHHDIPVGYFLRGKERPAADLVLNLFAWSRYAEISADRAGALCADDFGSVSSALFKLASGLSDDSVVQFSVEDFLRQLDIMQEQDAEPGQGASMQDWFSTHPFSPLRVRALQLFHNSALMRDGGDDRATLEAGVQGLMGLMEPNYMEGKTSVAKTMKLLFLAAAVAVANAVGGISESEEQVISDFLGPRFALKSLNPEKLIDTLPERMAATREQASTSQCMQVLRDLCTVANAEAETRPEEIEVLHRVAEGLDIPRGFVEQCMLPFPELD
jgi:tellurite resistance protein